MDNKNNKKLLIIFVAGLVIIVALIAILVGLNSPEEDSLTADEKSELFAFSQREKYPILANLPQNLPVFQLGYTYPDPSSTIPAIVIFATNTYLDTAVFNLRSLATDTGLALFNYNVMIKDFTSSLASPTESSNSDGKSFLLESFASVPEFAFISGETYEDYYYAKVSTGLAAHYNLVTYEVVIKKSGDSWEFATTPYPVLTTYNSPQVPTQILEKLESL